MRFRSVLFTPGTRPERIEKAWTNGGADVVVADLEDAVAPQQKAEARATVAGLLERVQAAEGTTRAVRINAWPSELGQQDLDALKLRPEDLIVVPKAEDDGELEALHERIDCDILAIIETAEGVLNVDAIAGVEGVAAVAFGAEDLAADAGMRRTPGNAEVAVPRSLVALAAAANRKASIDMITADYQDTQRFAREAEEAVGLGYHGKMCLHPSQVAAAHEAWTPSQADQEWARQVLDAVEVQGVGAGGVIVVDGQMIDVPLIRQAQRIVALADAP